MFRMSAAVLIFVAVSATRVAVQLPQQMIPKEVLSPGKPAPTPAIPKLPPPDPDEPEPLPADMQPLTPIEDPATGRPILVLERREYQMVLEIDNQCDWTTSVQRLQDSFIGVDAPPGKSYQRAFVLARGFASAKMDLKPLHREERKVAGGVEKICKEVEQTFALPEIRWVTPPEGRAPQGSRYLMPFPTFTIPMEVKTTSEPPAPSAEPPAQYDFSDDSSSSTFGIDYNSLSDRPEVTPTTPGRNTLPSFSAVQRKSVDFENQSVVWDKTGFNLLWNADDTEVTFTFKDEKVLPSDRDQSIPDYRVNLKKERDELFAMLLRGMRLIRDQIVARIEAAEPISFAQAVQRGGVAMLMIDQGGSTGRSIVAHVLNTSGRPVQLRGALAVEPVAPSGQKQMVADFRKAAAGKAFSRLHLNAYCVDFAKLPPSAGQYLRIAPLAAQRELAPLKKVMSAANRLTSAGALKPDSSPATYADSIKQWAIWTVEQKFNAKKFGDAFLDHTKKNVEGAGQKWTKQFEDVVRQRTPNRWNDIVQILKAAGATVPQ